MKVVNIHEAKTQLSALISEIESTNGTKRLPWRHSDSADRFIIATAVRDGLTVVTADDRFAPYGVPIIC